MLDPIQGYPLRGLVHHSEEKIANKKGYIMSAFRIRKNLLPCQDLNTQLTKLQFMKQMTNQYATVLLSEKYAKMHKKMILTCEWLAKHSLAG